jgi:hemerythrin
MNTFERLSVVFMDEDHEEFVDQLNSIEVLLKGEAADDAVDAALVKLIQHTREHFGHEEEQMAAINFPPYVPHKREHDRVLEGLEGMAARWQATRDAAWLQGQIANLWKWFEIHLDTMDRVTAHFIAKSGNA